MLEREINFFNLNKEVWIKQYPQKFALVKGEELIGTFDTLSDALVEASRRYGLDNYLIRKIAGSEEEIKIPAFSLGLLRANPSPTVRS